MKKTTEEDRKFIESFQIEKEYHSGMVDVMYWACGYEKGMYFILNDSPLGLVLREWMDLKWQTLYIKI